MTESSFFWDDTDVGDAVAYAPYSAQTWQKVWRILFEANQAKSGLIPGISTPLISPSFPSNYTPNIEVTSPTATTIHVGKGSAIINGTAYLVEDETITLPSLPSSGYVYYTLCLTFGVGEHITGLTLLSSVISGTVSYPPAQQDTLYWQIPLRHIKVDSSGIVCIIVPWDKSVALNNLHMPYLPYRQGGNATNWNTAGTTDYLLGRGTKIQIGTVFVDHELVEYYGTESVTFPHAFTYAPVVFANVATLIDTRLNYITCCVDNIANTGFEVSWYTHHISGPLLANGAKIFWMAIGQLAEF